MFCPHCGVQMVQMRHPTSWQHMRGDVHLPLYRCRPCQQTYTALGDPTTIEAMIRYTIAAKTAPMPRQDTEFDWDIGSDFLTAQHDISAQEMVKIRKVTPAYTDTQQEIADLQAQGFTDDQLQTFCGLRMAYPLLAG